MSNYYYSAVTNAFYPSALKQDYIQSGSWAEDAVAIDDSVYLEYAASNPPQGKTRIAGSDGMPSWDDIPPLDPEGNLLKNSETLRQKIQHAVIAITTLQAGIALNRSVEGDADALAAWQGYLCDLRAINQNQLQQSPIAFPPAPVSIF